MKPVILQNYVSYNKADNIIYQYHPFVKRKAAPYDFGIPTNL